MKPDLKRNEELLSRLRSLDLDKEACFGEKLIHESIPSESTFWWEELGKTSNRLISGKKEREGRVDLRKQLTKLRGDLESAKPFFLNYFVIVSGVAQDTLSDIYGSEKPLYTRSVPILDLGADDVLLTEPIQVEIECYDGEVISKIPELDLWASESTESEALLSIKHAILELWKELSEEDDVKLGKLPKAWKRILNQRIKANVTA